MKTTSACGSALELVSARKAIPLVEDGAKGGLERCGRACISYGYFWIVQQLRMGINRALTSTIAAGLGVGQQSLAFVYEAVAYSGL